PTSALWGGLDRRAGVVGSRNGSPSVAEPGAADRGDRRGSGPRDADGQPGVPARRRPPARRGPLALEALDLLHAQLAGPPARPDAAGSVDRAVLPRRSDRARRRAPAVRVLPQRRVPGVRAG